MESYDLKKSIVDINRDSGIVTDEDQQFLSFENLDANFNPSPTAATTTSTTSKNYLNLETTSSNSILGKIEYGQDDDGDTILHLAAVGCTIEVMEDLIKRCDLNATNNMNQTPLHVASMANRPEIVELLLNCGARLNVHDWRGQTPLHLACERGFSEVVIVILETIRMATTNGNGVGGGLIKSSSSILRHYLGLKNFDGQSCLHLAAANNRVNIMDLLLNRYDADANCQDSKSGATILHDAITKLNVELVRYILNCSPNKHCNRTDFYGRSPLDTIAMLQRSQHNQTQSDKLGLINELVKDRIKLCIAQNSGCCAATNLRLNEAILDSSSSSDYTDSDSDLSN